MLAKNIRYFFFWSISLFASFEGWGRGGGKGVGENMCIFVFLEFRCGIDISVLLRGNLGEWGD